IPEIVLDCHAFLFTGRRLGGLTKRVAAGEKIDGLIRYHLIQQFLIERQREEDPVGHRAFRNVLRAVRQLASDGALTADGPRVVSDTRLSLSTSARTPVDEARIQDAIRGDGKWDCILPELGRTTRPAREGLLSLLPVLIDRVGTAVSTRSLVGAL